MHNNVYMHVVYYIINHDADATPAAVCHPAVNSELSKQAEWSIPTPLLFLSSSFVGINKLFECCRKDNCAGSDWRVRVSAQATVHKYLLETNADEDVGCVPPQFQKRRRERCGRES